MLSLLLLATTNVASLVETGPQAVFTSPELLQGQDIITLDGPASAINNSIHQEISCGDNTKISIKYNNNWHQKNGFGLIETIKYNDTIVTGAVPYLRTKIGNKFITHFTIYDCDMDAEKPVIKAIVRLFGKREAIGTNSNDIFFSFTEDGIVKK